MINKDLARMLALRKELDPEAPDAIVFREQYMGDFENTHAAKYPQKVLADLLDAGEISVAQYERLRRESVDRELPLLKPKDVKK